VSDPFGSVPTRDEPAFPNTSHVATREYRELVRSRIFHVSTITLTLIALIVALLARARRIDDESEGAALAATVNSEAFRLALGRIACGYDGGQIYKEDE